MQVADDELDMLACADCGRQPEVCGDPQREWFPQRQVCYPTMEQAAAAGRYDRLHEREPFHDGTFARWSEKPDEGHPYHYKAGVSIYVAERDVNPDDDFLTGRIPEWDEDSANGEG